MTQQQEEHLDRLKQKTLQLLDLKYRKGQAEHGGNLWGMSIEQLLDAAIDEAIDQVTYLQTAKEKLTATQKALNQTPYFKLKDSEGGHNCYPIMDTSTNEMPLDAF